MVEWETRSVEVAVLSEREGSNPSSGTTRMWWNGRHAWLRTMCRKWRKGSNPFIRTRFFSRRVGRVVEGAALLTRSTRWVSFVRIEYSPRVCLEALGMWRAHPVRSGPSFGM